MLRVTALAALLAIAFVWGFAAGAYDVFPYPQARAVKAALLGDEPVANAQYKMSKVPSVSAERYSLLETKAEIVMVGDSITASGRWDELFPEASIINRGVPGDIIGGLELRTDGILNAEPGKVFIMIGINDVAARNTNAQILSRYKRVVKELQSGGATVFVQAVIPCRDSPYGPCDETMRMQTKALNPMLQDLARELGAEYIAVDDALADDGGFMEKFSIDGIHPNAAGFAAWAKLIEPNVLDTQSGEAAP